MALREVQNPPPKYRVSEVSEAHGCGASGCREEEPVFEVESVDGRSRVLCADHALAWMCR